MNTTLPNTLAGLLGLLLLAGPLPASAGEVLAERIDALEPFLGAWEIEARWSGGEALWAQSVFEPILGGAFVEARTFVRDGDGEVYQRYRSILGWDAECECLASWDFVHDGTTHSKPFDVERVGEGLVGETEWELGEARVRERIEIGDDGLQHWQVWMRGAGEDEERQVMDGRWRRIAPTDVVRLPEPAGLEERLEALDPFLGAWEIASTWPDGSPLWSRNVYRAGLNGWFLDETTWALDAAGGYDPRYETVFTSGDEPGTFRLIGFTATGEVTTGTVRFVEDEGPGRFEFRVTPEPGATTEFGQVIRFESSRAFGWQVRTRPVGTDAWSAVLDGVWLATGEPRREEEMTAPIDDGAFVDSGPRLRSFVKERTIDAPVAAVYAAWSSAEGWSRVYGDPALARIELAIGGRYEWLFDGTIGSNGCQVLSYVPDRMISFSWNAPPAQQDNRLRRTWVVVETEPAGEGATRVRLTHLGFGEGPAWDETFAYFEAAWDRVLDAMQRGLGPAS